MPLLGRQMTKREVAKFLYEAGWTDAINLPKMIATSYAESNLFIEAYHWNDPEVMVNDDPDNPKYGDGSTDWGYLQLTDGNKGGLRPRVVDGHPQPIAGGIKSLAELQDFVAMALDPFSATVTARKMFVVRGFQPWVAYLTGAYKEFIPAANLGVNNYVRERVGLPLA